MALQLQMSWQPSLLSPKRKNKPPLGLRNLGNSCYLNSVLQCLTYTAPLANFCLKNQHSSFCDSGAAATEGKRECPFCLLEKRIARSHRVDLPQDAPLKIQSCLRIFSDQFRCGRQEDAHEFLRFVIDACHNTCLRLKKLRRKGGGGGGEAGNGSSSTVVKEIFGGALQSQVKCMSCGAESNKVDEIMDINLELLHCNSVKEAMQRFFQPEILDGSNKYQCENCKKLVTAQKQMSIYQAPNILVIQLKRFEYGGKIDKYIAFEDVLVLSSFMCKTSQDPQPEYNLFGTIVHSGLSPDSGHYYAYIKDAVGRWYCCNDSYVSLSTLQEVLSEKVYMLFFTRSNQRPVSALSNGVKKSHDRNGSEASKSLKASHPLKSVQTKPYVGQPNQIDTSTISKVDKGPSSPKIKFNVLGNSNSNNSKTVPVTSNGKVDVQEGPLMQTNGNGKNSIHEEKSKKYVPLLVNGNGSDKNKEADGGNPKNSQAYRSQNGNGHVQSAASISAKSDIFEGSVTRNGVTAEKGLGHHETHNGSVNGHSNISGLKRTSRECCILLAQDAESLGKVDELKADLEKYAASALRSCGWVDEAHRIMRSEKRFCTREAGITPSCSEFKKSLIAKVKPTCLPQIPETLKEQLIESLRSFSQEKQHFPGFN